MRRSIQLTKVLILIALASSLTGCWDKIEIEDRMIIGNICIDSLQEDVPKGTELDFIEKGEKKKYLISFTAAVPGNIKENKSPAYKTYSTTANNIGMANWQVMKRYSQVQYFGHAKTITFGEDTLKSAECLKSLLDSFIRGHDYNKSMDVYVMEGRADKIVEVVPKFSNYLVAYITGISQNQKYVSTIQRSSLDQLIRNLVNSDGDAIMPKIAATKEEVKIGGGGILKDYVLVGYLDDAQSRALGWIDGDAKGGMIEIKIKGAPITFRFYDFNTKMKLDKVEKGKLYISYNMEVEGNIEEYILGQSFMDEAILRECESLIQKQIQDDSMEVIQVLQKKYKVDLIKVRDYLSKYQPAVYDQIKEDFDNYYTDNIVLNVNTKVKVRRVGTMR